MVVRNQKTILSLTIKKVSLNIHTDKIVYRPALETTILVSFPVKISSYAVINLLFSKLSNLSVAKVSISTKTAITLQTSVKKLRAFTMCSAFSPDCGYDNSTFNLIGDVFCPKKSVRVKFACTKGLFKRSAEAFINVRNEHLCARCPKLLLKIKQIPFSFLLVKRFTFMKRLQKQFKMILEMSIVWANNVSAEKNWNLLTVM